MKLFAMKGSSAFRNFHFLAVQAMVLIYGISCPSMAQAQGTSVTLQKGQLQRVTWPTAPLQIQILDERPRVKDLRTPEQAAESYVIPIPPMAGAQGQNGAASSVRMERSTLPQAGFGQSNISPRGMGPARSLPSTRSGGLSPVDKHARPIGFSTPGNHPELAVSAKAPIAAATYGNDHSHGMGLHSGSSGSEKSIREIVKGDVVHH